MIISNKEILLHAMEHGSTFTLDKKGNVKKQCWLSSLIQKFTDLFRSSHAINVRQQCLQIAMANIIDTKSILQTGPRNLQQQLNLTSRPIKEITAKAQKILCDAMIKDVVCKTFTDENLQSQEIIIKYLQNKWSNESTTKPISYPQIKSFLNENIVECCVEKTLYEKPVPIRKGVSSFLRSRLENRFPGKMPLKEYVERYVKRQITHWETLEKNNGENVMAHLACGYTMNPEDLTEHMKSLKRGLEEAIRYAWKEEKLDQFSPSGIYNIFMLDVSRDRHPIQGERVPYSENADNAKVLYKKMIEKEFPDFSMAAIVSILGSQTALIELGGMIMCSLKPPLNPYLKEIAMTVSEVAPLVHSGNSTEPRIKITHNNKNVSLELSYKIQLTHIPLSIHQVVGDVRVDVIIPKDQFPIPVGTIPDIQVQNMKVNRPYGFVGS